LYLDLVAAAQRGDPEAFAALARLSADRLFAIAARITRDRQLAEDALQQALVTIWKELPRLRDPERFEAWTYRLIVRCAVRESRAMRGPRPELYLVPERHVAPGDTSADVANRDQLDRSFQRLTPDQRAVTVLHFYVGLSLAEIASTLGVPLGTVGSRLHYAKRALRAALEADARAEEWSA
jgi:RNA polymerase sigma-70 factor (ECF subfamily)